MPRILGLAPILIAGCLSAASREDLRRLETSLEGRGGRTTAAPAAVPAAPVAAAPAAPAAPAPEPAGEAAPSRGADLAGPLDLRTLNDEALARNPEVGESLERARGAVEEVRRAGALDDPILKLETWAVPLERPAAFDRADTNMFGLSQTFPFPGKLGLRAEAALRDAEAAREAHRTAASGLIARVKRAYFEYYMLAKEREIHLEHVRLLESFERVAEAKFRTGTARQQDVLKAQIELVTLHNDVLFIDQRLGSARAAINALLNRPPGAALGPPGDVTPTSARHRLEDLEEKAFAGRPDLKAVELESRSAELDLELARRDAILPDLMLGVDYWQMNEGDDAWGGFVGINLPWLTGKRRAEARKLEHAARAGRLAVERARQVVTFEVRDAYLRHAATRESVILVNGELLPKASQSVEVTRASYENDRATFLELLDAERSYRDVQLAYFRALAAHESALADLERAAGINLESIP
ncbi:MAG: TolC family protein [Planctomycetes bacterium]|nr:TolC family protein [Planctomycetota bacterium]